MEHLSIPLSLSFQIATIKLLTHTSGGQQWTGELRSLPPVSVGENRQLVTDELVEFEK